MAKLKGNYRPSRYKDELTPEGLQYIKEVPSYPLSLNEDGKYLWDSILGSAIHLNGFIAIHDLFMFEQLCYTHQLICEAQQDIKKYGMFRLTEKKEAKSSAFFRSYMELVKTYIVLCREFGLSPSSRDGIKIISKTEVYDPLKEFVL